MIEIDKCRMCSDDKLDRVVSLGNMSLSGIFPASKDDQVPEGPLDLVKCSTNNGGCGLVQMAQNYNPDDMYNEAYGYTSSLNSSMVNHLNNKIKLIENSIKILDQDMIIDIGSNDATSLLAYSNSNILKVGVDPVGNKFKDIYLKNNITLIDDFFSNEIVNKLPKEKAKVITSFSMFYDLPDPLGFSKAISDILEDGGIWVMEQSYMPMMIDRNSFDTICHEHLEFYALTQIKWIADKVGLKIINCDFNDVNGGSFSVVLAKNDLFDGIYQKKIQKILDEEAKNIHNLNYYKNFQDRIIELKKESRAFLENIKKSGKKVCGLGASTKGNITLQYFEINDNDLESILDVNDEKFGCVSPGSHIKILPENEENIKEYDYFYVLIWHFKDHLLKNKNFKGKKLIFPLPNFEVISL